MSIISNVSLSDLKGYRIDAEYYKPELKKISDIIERHASKKLSSIASVNGGKRLPKGSTFSNEGIPYVRVVDIDKGFITDEKVAYISLDIWKRISKYDIKKDDILVTIVGNSVGQTGVLNIDLGTANFTENCARIRNSQIDEHYLFSFLLSKFGQGQVEREKVGTSQPKLSLDRLRNFQIPILSDNYTESISRKMRIASERYLASKLLYTQATQLLEDALGLNSIEFKKEKSYTAYASEVASTRRMNAEYFSPTVKSILQQDFFKNSQPLGMIFQIIRGTTPKEYFALGVPVLKTKNVRVPEIDKERIADFVQSTKDLTEIRNQDLLLASMGVGSLGRMSYISNLEQSYVVDGTIRVLRPKPTTPENFQIPTLLFLSSKVGQELIYRGIVGSTGIISLPDDYLKKIPIPIFSPELCEQLTLMVSDSIEAKRESKELLEQAKHEVETLIEQAAQTA